jgi:hypothetical protein
LTRAKLLVPWGDFCDEIKVMCGDQKGKAQLLHLGSSPSYELLKFDHYQQAAYPLGISELLFTVSITCVYRL